jgi:TctA family transporter
MWEASLSALEQMFSWKPMLGMLLTLPFALFAGITPGGGLPFTAVILGFVGALDVWTATLIVIFQAAASDITEPIPSILMGIPGSRTAQATVLDGYPMARKGLAGVALGASYTTQLIAGCIGAALLFASIPAAQSLLRLFGSAEFLALSLLGLMTVAIVSSGAIIKGMLTAGFGLCLAMVGFEHIGSVVRATLGIEFLFDGIPLVPVVIGLFALPEIIDLVVGDMPIAMDRLETMMKDAQKDVYRGMREALNHKWLIVKASVIGTFVGALPGLGGSAAHWITYAYARQTEPGAKETFGKGDVRGVMAADAANNSSDGGLLIPTVAFGIPGSGGMAVFMTMLILYGITPGPQMLDQHLDLTIAFAFTIAFANIIVIPIILFFSAPITKIAAIPPNILAPGVIALVTISAFQSDASMGDLLLVLVFGVLGIFMKLYAWPRPPILIALTLGDIVEKYLWISTNTWGWSMFLRPQFVVIFTFMLFVLYGAMKVRKDSKKIEKAAEAEGGEAAPEPAPAVASGSVLQAGSDRKTISWEILGEVILLGIVAFWAIYLFGDSMNWFGGRKWPLGASLAPWIAVAITVPFLIIRVVHVLRLGFWVRHGAAGGPRGQILDVGFRLGDDPAAEGRRFARIGIAILVLYAGIWAFGFHVTMPLWVFGYMFWFGNVSLFWSAFMAILFEILIWGIYDYALDSPWNVPLIMPLLQDLFPTVFNTPNPFG